jgi:hypothetical protein
MRVCQQNLAHRDARDPVKDAICFIAWIDQQALVRHAIDEEIAVLLPFADGKNVET